MSVAIRFPMRFDSLGRTVSTINSTEVWTDRARVLLATMIGERVGDSTYGTNAAEHLFVDVDEMPTLVEGAVQSAFSRYLPELNLVGVFVKDGAAPGSTLDLTVIFTLGAFGPEVSLNSVVRIPGVGVIDLV